VTPVGAFFAPAKSMPQERAATANTRLSKIENLRFFISFPFADSEDDFADSDDDFKVSQTICSARSSLRPTKIMWERQTRIPVSRVQQTLPWPDRESPHNARANHGTRPETICQTGMALHLL
jgi:hypothetical protein